MAKAVYVGIDNIARKIKGAYIGVDGVARKVKKAYIGIDGVAQLCYEGKPPAVLIEFTVAGRRGEVYGTYQAEEGMTWIDFIESEYNPPADEASAAIGEIRTFGILDGSNYVSYSHEGGIMSIGATVDKVIENGKKYTATVAPV